MSLTACIAGLLAAAASALPPSPADGIRDDARVFPVEARAVLSAEMQAFTSASGIRLFIDTNTYLEADVNPGERCRQLVRAWCGEEPGVVICVDRASKPMHAIQISPALWARSSELEIMPALLAAAEQIGRSQVSAEGLTEGARTLMKRLTRLEKLARARERAWVEVSSALLNGIATLYNAADDARLGAARAALRARFEQVEAVLAARGEGPWFAGARFGLVDAAFAPVFRYFEVIPPDGLFDRLPRVQAWQQALAVRPSVQAAAVPGYAQRLRVFLDARGGALSRRLATMPA